MKSLYDKNFKYTEDALAFANEIFNAIRPIFEKYSKIGFSPRELSHIAQAEIMDKELDTILSIDYSLTPTCSHSVRTLKGNKFTCNKCGK